MAGENWLNPGADEISPLSERIEDAMRDAVEAARQGIDHPLADLLRDDHPFNKLDPPILSRLTPEAFRLIADRLDGKPRNPHAPKMTAQAAASEKSGSRGRQDRASHRVEALGVLFIRRRPLHS
jgi:hypothetical protein